MTSTFYLQATASDLGGGADWSVKLLAPIGSPTQLTATIAASSTETQRAFTEPGFFNNPQWETGNIVVSAGFTAAQPLLQFLAIQLHRVNAAGTIQESQTISAEQAAAASTVNTYTFTGLTWSAGGVGDRLRVDFVERNAAVASRVFRLVINDTGGTQIVVAITTYGTLIGRALVPLGATGGAAGALAAVGRSLLSLSARSVAAGAGAVRGRSLLGTSARSVPAGAAAAAGRSLASVGARGVSAGAGALRGRALASAAARGVPAGAGAIRGRSLVSVGGRASWTAIGAMIGRAIFSVHARSGPLLGAGAIRGRGLASVAARAKPAGAGSLRGRVLIALAARIDSTAAAEAIVGCFERIAQAVRDRYVAYIEVAESVPTLHDNAPPQDMGAHDIWIRFSVQVVPTDQLVFGPGGEQAHRYLGTASARIFMREGLGDADAWELAGAINAAFRGVTDDGIVYSPPPAPTVRGVTGDRWEIDVDVPFYALCDEAVLA